MKKVYFYNQNKEKLSGVFSENKSNKGIILVHGFKGNKNHAFIPELAKELSKKYNVLSFDFSGNGESEGKFEDQCYSKYIEELNIAINYVKKQGIKKICIISHSLGGNISLLEKEKYNDSDFDILIAPALKPKSNYYIIKKIIYPILNSGEKLNRKFFLERLVYNPIKAIKGNEKIILAEKDRAINLRKTIKLCKKFNLYYKIIKNAKHNFYGEQPYIDLKNEILKLLKNF